MNKPPTFDHLLNFRDVGKFVNQASAGNTKPRLREGLLFRSAKLDDTTLNDREKLVSQFAIRTVIDLRSKTEHINAAKKHSDAAILAQPDVVPAPNSTAAIPLKVPGLEYAEINLNGKGFERALIWQLKYSSLAKLICLMAMGYRTQGISVLGREIMLPKGLVGLGLDTIDHSGPEIKEVFDVLAEASSYPILIHCTQGKDRTGIIILLVLLLCEINLGVISADYVLSESELESEKEERMKEIQSIGLDESFAQCPPDFCQRISEHMDVSQGGVRQYLESIGIDKKQQDKIRKLLCI
jgi:protein tyrosine/serine phosphatase